MQTTTLQIHVKSNIRDEKLYYWIQAWRFFVMSCDVKTILVAMVKELRRLQGTAALADWNSCCSKIIFESEKKTVTRREFSRRQRNDLYF